MAASKIIMQSADGASVGLTIPDGVASGERQISLGANLSGITAYHLLQGNLAVSNSTITKGFGTTLYTSGSAVTDIDMDTQWGNDSSERFGGLVWLKDRTEATNNFLYDTVRGATKEINTNTTEAEATLAGGLTGFTSTGFTVGADAGHNSTTNNMVSWNFQTTHRVSGTTNHGKAFTEHYNPFTGFTIIKYEGSGLAGHEIPHSLGRKLGFVTVKNLSAQSHWATSRDDGKYLGLNETSAELTLDVINRLSLDLVVLGANTTANLSTNQHIMYGWANSYFDESNKLIGNYEIGVYQGNGATGNKVTTKGKPAWLMIKRLDNTGNWYILDNQRGFTSGNSNFLIPNSSAAESSNSSLIALFNIDGFTNNGTSIDINASGGQYLYMVVYDNDNGSGKSKYPKAADSSQLQINALIPFANGIDGNGAKNTILSKNETITGLTYTQGKNYVYCDKNGSYGRMSIAPNYGKVNPANGGDFYNVITNKWFTSAGVEITNSRNYLNHIVHADNYGGVLYVEELPKIEYKDIVKANEFRGKNACTAWANIDMTTTPPTIRDSYGITGIIRTATGRLSGYVNMDRSDYIVIGSGEISQDGVNASPAVFVNPSRNLLNTTSQFNIEVKGTDGSNYNAKLLEVFIMGGKNS